MAKQTITIKKRTSVTIKPKPRPSTSEPRSELSDVRSANAKKQKRSANGRFV